MTNSELVRDIFAAIDGSNFDKVSAKFDKNVKITGIAPNPFDLNQYLGFVRALNAAFPDINRHAVVLSEGKDGEVRGEMQVTGTHNSALELPIIPKVEATGKRVSLPRAPFTMRIKNGKVVSYALEGGPDAGLIGALKQVGRDDVANCLRTQGADCRTDEAVQYSGAHHV